MEIVFYTIFTLINAVCFLGTYRMWARVRRVRLAQVEEHLYRNRNRNRNSVVTTSRN